MTMNPAVTTPDETIMHGTIINLAHLEDRYIGRFLKRWREDAHAAFTELVGHKFIEFSKSGMGHEYWTWFDELGPEVIPQSELAQVAIGWLEANKASMMQRGIFHIYIEIMALRIDEIGLWLIDNFESHIYTIELLRALGEQDYAKKLRDTLIFAIARAARNTGYEVSPRIQKFVREYWMENPSFTLSAIFETAFPQKDKDHQKALVHWVKIKRRGLGNLLENFKRDTREYPKKLKRLLPELHRQQLESHISGVMGGLLTYFGFFRKYSELTNKYGYNHADMPETDRDELHRIKEKVQRFMIAQNMFFPL